MSCDALPPHFLQHSRVGSEVSISSDGNKNKEPQNRGSLNYCSVFVCCRSGFRAYLAARILAGHGIDAVNITSGWNALRLPKTN